MNLKMYTNTTIYHGSNMMIHSIDLSKSKNTKYYLYEGDITQHKILASKQQKFRPKYIRTFTLFLQETKPNKVA